ncbi:hypothetical protein DM793_20970 [Paenarthrobacter nitroguajacolicus]|uniref:hypothetical protein n=1 Tax=Paenarthrobacter nitroguajacolicus TaxID=211146 RepID=UPI0015BBC20B|nr:hypothetical protein [Paenarthrobacter nitroguajacolicus]NWL13739.1 hypothetical protein [Paenarthrobacter nitroguajacolicus]
MPRIGGGGPQLDRTERRKQARTQRRWLSAVSKVPGMDPETVEVAAWIASRVGPDGTISDPLAVRLLHEADAEAGRG